MSCYGYVTCSLWSKEYVENIFGPIACIKMIFWRKTREDDSFCNLILTPKEFVDTKNAVKLLFFRTFWTSKASRKFSMGLKYMLWVCKTFSRIRGIERTSNHVRTTRREKTAYPIPKTCGKRTSEPPIQFYFSNFWLIFSDKSPNFFSKSQIGP